MSDDLYKRYTSTSVFIGQDEKKLTDWSLKYFNHNILPHLPEDRGAVILDIGCGYGRYLLALKEKDYKKVIGIDVSEEQVNYATKKLGLENVTVADAIDVLNKETKEYDAVLLLDVIEHLEVDYSIQLLSKIYKSLKSGGVLILQAPNAISPLAVHRHWDITHKRAYTVHSLEQSLMLAGFSQIQHYPLPPFIHNFKSVLRLMLWSGFINPLVKAYMLIANGDRMGGVYTSNILSVAKR